MFIGLTPTKKHLCCDDEFILPKTMKIFF